MTGRPMPRARRSTATVLAALASAALVLCWAGPGRAYPLPHADRDVAYAVVDQDLPELLGDLGSQLGVRVQVSQAVRGRVRGRLPPAPPAAFLERLAAIHGFDWYFDGATLFVSGPSEAVTRVLPLGPVPLPGLAQVLDELGISDPRWPLRASSGAGLVFAGGPPRYVALIEQALDALRQRSRPSPEPRVFRGSAASLRL